jgi:hypothetical protein|tara:strand:- start:627 stop:797 length:171 start_codon:yes stop_codon:yes gene_type:complete
MGTAFVGIAKKGRIVSNFLVAIPAFAYGADRKSIFLPEFFLLGKRLTHPYQEPECS